MSYRFVNCMIPTCSSCGADYLTDYVPHFDSTVEMREATVDGGWRTDGLHGDWCDACQKADHEHVPDPDSEKECARCGELIDPEDES